MVCICDTGRFHRGFGTAIAVGSWWSRRTTGMATSSKQTDTWRDKLIRGVMVTALTRGKKEVDVPQKDGRIIDNLINKGLQLRRGLRSRKKPSRQTTARLFLCRRACRIDRAQERGVRDRKGQSRYRSGTASCTIRRIWMRSKAFSARCSRRCSMKCQVSR